MEKTTLLFSPKRKKNRKQQPAVLFYKRCPSSDSPISLLKIKSAFLTVADRCELPAEYPGVTVRRYLE